ncbi:hypothetical protein [Streptomyces natalensis]|uniref:hypothetical protein n=1 Tax=Streptomyces natalensis TaxID=68242 RepID=UPI0004AA5F93|nr:hypothetical protein [Streptomyces natalensis]
MPDDMTDTAPWAGPGIVRVAITADDLATARAAAARIATLWDSRGDERGQLPEEDASARLCADGLSAHAPAHAPAHPPAQATAES